MWATWDWRRSVESPWFYATWFCLFGAVALLVAAEKYGERQAGIERRFQARSQTAVVPRAGEAASAPDAETASRAYSSPEDTVIPLWPLGAVLGGLACVFACLAYRVGIEQKANTAPPDS